MLKSILFGIAIGFIIGIIFFILVDNLEILGINQYPLDTNSANRTFYKCSNKHNPPTKHIITKNNYIHIDKITSAREQNTQPGLFLPCTYTNAEHELDRIHKNTVNNTDIFMIQGCDIIAAKDTLWKLLEKSYSRNGAAFIMPETYLAGADADMALFKIRFQPGKPYILKKNMQRKEGLLVIRAISFQQLERIMHNGGFLVIQEYILEPLIINTRKLNLRIYVLIVCNPHQDSSAEVEIKGYLYKGGKCIYTNKAYSPNTVEDMESQITSVNLDMDIYKYNPETLKELEEYLTFARYEKVWNSIQKKLGMVILAIKAHGGICKKDGFKGKSQFQLFGVDILLDENLEPWILEFNKGPDMVYKTEKDQLTKEALLEDTFCFKGLGSCSNPSHSPSPSSNSSNWINLIS